MKTNEYEVIPTLGNVYTYSRKKHERGDILNDYTGTLRVVANLGKENGLYKLRVEKIQLIKF
jgi:hypothetical protein